MLHKRRINYISEVWVGNSDIKGNNEIRKAAKSFFPNLHMEPFNKRPTLDGLEIKRLSLVSKQFLEAAFTEEEVLECLKSAKGNKYPGPDGFNMKFVHECWHLIKEDVICMFNELHKSGRFVKSLNSTFLVLIPKK